MTSGFKLIYEERGLTELIDINLNRLSTRVGYDGEYEIFQHNNNNTYYYAKVDIEDSDSYFMFAYIKADNDKKGLTFINRISCLDRNQTCEIEIESEEEKIKKIMTSIEFK
ncbi:hypothetical protein MM221_06240 [Salipaludibacillus sp. LMS25]|jgi:hypothetical protein|uniref:hypothetical protein n=1 Tax=Salipaludibacillus sp. LMS25 TaxID=2924031 RepID=UPI0020D07EEE|nr:hypothetical protein [Salipaludibacillus sp. LMS25]UTR16156.1 hypothetical protein MM221_06240 [Salipaludibacillus sp. LMS25]